MQEMHCQDLQTTTKLQINYSETFETPKESSMHNTDRTPYTSLGFAVYVNHVNTFQQIDFRIYLYMTVTDIQGGPRK